MGIEHGRVTTAGVLLLAALQLACDDGGQPAAEQPELAADAGALGVIDIELPPLWGGGTGTGAAGAADAGASGQGGAGQGGAGAPAPDAAPADDAAVDAGLSAVPFDGGGVAISGITLTNQPQLGFLDSGDDGLVIVSAFIRVLDSGSFFTVRLHGEVENRSALTRCIPLFTTCSVGDQAVIAVVDGPVYTGSGSVSSVCLQPGERGVWRGIENEVSATLIEDSREFRYAIAGLERFDQVPNPLSPTLLGADRVLDAFDLYKIVGQMRSAAQPIYNLQVVFYVKDARGLVVDDTSAFPLDMATIPASMTLDYESYSFFNYREEPEALLHFFEFISGPAPSTLSTARVAPPQTEAGLQEQQHRQRSDEYQRRWRRLVDR